MLTDAVDVLRKSAGYIIERQVPIHALPPHSPSVPGSPLPLLPPPPPSKQCPNQTQISLVASSKSSSYPTMSVCSSLSLPAPAHLPQICSFCYIANKSLHDAIEACRDLPIRFDVEFRPFTLMCSSLHPIDANKGISRSAYLAKKFGKEQAEAKWKVASDMAQRAGLKMCVFLGYRVLPSVNNPPHTARKMVSSVGQPKHTGSP